MNTDWSRAARLHAVEFLACWTVLNLGDTPLQLQLRSVGRTLDERDRIYRGALGELARRGLVDPTRLTESPLAGALRLLATARSCCDLRLEAAGADRPTDEGTDPAELVAVGAMAGEYGVVAVRTGELLTLLPVSGPRVPAALIELIGPLNPARARPVNVPADLLDQACRAAAGGGLWALTDRLVELGVLPAEASSLARMCTGLVAAGQLGVTVRDPDGRERRGRWVVGFHRAEIGDCLQLRRPTGPGQQTVTIAPVTARQLFDRFTELLRDTEAGQGPRSAQMAYGQPVSA